MNAFVSFLITDVPGHIFLRNIRQVFRLDMVGSSIHHI
jgi:hypothetical protein